MKGKLIVFEGTDGSGKGTQMQLLVSLLKEKHIPYETLDFPRYGQSFFGDLAGRMLAGDFGAIDQIPSYLATLPYACDRWLCKKDLLHWLSDGKIVISNRYTASSAVYQAAKEPIDKRMAFIDWVYRMEQEVIGLPKEDMVLYFHVPREISKTLIEKKDKREYLGDKKKDIYEESDAMQITVEGLYDALMQKFPHWKMIDCVADGVLRSPQEIQKDLVDELTRNGIL